MSKLLFGMMILAGLASTCLSQEPVPLNYQPFNDHNLSPIPSGLRFQGVEDPLLQRAAGERGWAYIGGGPGWNGGGGCNCGGGNMLCSHWTLRGWYSSWDDHGGHGHGNSCCKQGGRCGSFSGFGY